MKWNLLVLCYIILFIIGFYVLFNINMELTKIHKQMEDDKITKYIDSGWMPPLDFVKTLRKKTRDKK